MCRSMGPTSAALFQFLLLVMMLEEVVKMLRPRQESETVEGDGADGTDQDAALNYSIPESPQSAGVEHPSGPTHNTTQDQDEGKPITTVEFLEDSSSKASKRGTKRATTMSEISERKKTKRCENWTDDETTKLIMFRLQSLRDSVGRVGKIKSNESVWEAICKHIPGRTGEQCQNRWDVVVRFYKRIESHLDRYGKQFSQVTEKDFDEMKVASYFRSADWYHMFGEQREVWDFRNRSTGCRSLDMNGTSTSATGMSALPRAGSLNPDEFPPEVVTTSSPLDQSAAAMAACESTAMQSQIMKLASSKSTIC